MSPERVVLVTDHPWSSIDEEVAALAAVGARLEFAPTGASDELIAMARNADAILTCFAHVSEAVVASADHLQAIGRYGSGVDNIAVDRRSGGADRPGGQCRGLHTHTLGVRSNDLRGRFPPGNPHF